MAEGFEIKVPITVKGGKKEGRGIGKSIAEQIKKTVGSLGIGGGGAAAAGGKAASGGIVAAGITKMTGLLAIIAIAISSLDFILKPVMGFLKAILTLLFMPLIPILKPVLMLLGIMAKTLAPIMQKVSSIVETLISKSIIPFALEAAERLGEFYGNFALLFLNMIQIFLENLPSISDTLSWFAEKSQVFFNIILGVLTWAADFLATNWNEIKGALEWVSKWFFPGWDVIKDILSWAAEFLEPIWDNIKSILVDAADTILPKLSEVVVKLGNILIDLYNAISKMVERFSFGLFGGQQLEHLSASERLPPTSELIEMFKKDPTKSFNGFPPAITITNNITGDISREVDLDEIARRAGNRTEMELKKRGILI